ncbi:aspartate/glutamate racemase family protein [Photobacterium damselae]|uniref:aspartate/glutamate racemase family protein n=1 Tax=Photobacterium damselae TaxID=38293 RepID=UPI002208B8F6|nr:aspartate/glutamate racemase family protein [Photobacterium damselae]WIH18530.1 aspartate/glutamate racemase family protein [Photobacterium damselae]BDR34748.1 aspartate racemase [Photobacterium damselae subsp. damselae]
MKTIGLLGGMSWESTLSYYKSINEGVKEKLGGLNSAKICMYSVNFEEIEKLQHSGHWDETARILSDAAVSIENGGADFILICTNTMHKVVPEIEVNINIPILHIADATAEKLLESGIKKVGLLGTNFTMEQDFYKGRLTEKFGIEVVVPEKHDRLKVHEIIYQELCRGQIKNDSRAVYIQIIDKLRNQGVDAVILGCTEIALLVQQQHTSVPLFDTTAIHAEAAVRLATNKD